VIFCFLGVYAVKFSELIQNNVEYEYNLTMHYGKLALEAALLLLSAGTMKSLNSGSFLFVVLEDDPVYYLALRYLTNVLIWVSATS
jgi:hypothetical protein